MSLIKTRLALLSHDQSLVQYFLPFEPMLLNSLDEDFDALEIEILIYDLNLFQNISLTEKVASARKAEKIKKIVLIVNDDSNTSVSLSAYNSLNPDKVKKLHQFQSEDLFELSSDIQQTAQNNVYVNLSTELNVEYEKIKLELESKLDTKAKNLIESRQKIFEINSRIEFLRKTLYTISEIKSLDTAEEKLNTLLTSYNKVTWFKIISVDKSETFENDIENQLESTLFKSDVHVLNQNWYLYFFKGDKKPYKKNDILLFKKLSETLQINLSRIDNLTALKQNENFYICCFFSCFIFNNIRSVCA